MSHSLSRLQLTGNFLVSILSIQMSNAQMLKSMHMYLDYLCLVFFFLLWVAVINFSSDADDRKIDTGMEFKSHQWFGATVRSDGEHILVSTGEL